MAQGILLKYLFSGLSIYTKVESLGAKPLEVLHAYIIKVVCNSLDTDILRVHHGYCCICDSLGSDMFAMQLIVLVDVFQNP